MLETMILGDKEKFYYLLPEAVREALIDNGGFLVGATEDVAGFVGIAAFSYSAFYEDDVELKYIFVLESHRERGISTLMLEYVLHIIKEHGIRTVSCKLSGTVSGLLPLYEYLLLQDFIPIVLNGRILKYQISDVMNCKAMKPVLQKKFDFVKSFSELDQQAIRIFFNIMIQKKIFHQNQEFDHDLSRFYVKNNEIIGCMLFKVQKNNNEIDILSMFLLHMDEKAENGLAFPAMLADCVVAANEKYADETVLELGIFLPQLCEALCNVLGEPEQEEYFQQYLRIL